MNSQTLEKIKRAVKEVESLLVEQRYEQIDSNVKEGGLTSQEIANAIEEYKGQLSMAPKSAYDSLVLFELKNTKLKSWAVDFDLWVDQEPSDLTLQLTIIEKDGKLISTVDDIHVL